MAMKLPTRPMQGPMRGLPRTGGSLSVLTLASLARLLGDNASPARSGTGGRANRGANTVRSGWAALLASAAVLIPMAAIEANAGAFGLREQSTVGQGDAFAGVAAGGALSSMFWNPATMTQTTGFGIEGNGTGILSNVDQHPLAGSTLLPRGFGGAGDTGSPALLFSGYSTWQ